MEWNCEAGLSSSLYHTTFINVNGQGYEGVENRGEIEGGQMILEGLGEAFEQNVKQGRGVPSLSAANV